MENILLEARNLHVSYGAIKALQGFSLVLKEREIVSVIGANGAGKSTFMNAVMGMVKRDQGEVILGGRKMSNKSYQVVQGGLSMVPEGRRIFAPLTVLENLQIGAFPRAGQGDIKKDMEWVFSLFPRLKERIGQHAGTLSGGEQQMLAIARALMPSPKLLMLDEPSLGIAPRLVLDIFKAIQEINGRGLPVLLLEQRLEQTLKIAQRAYVIQTGRVVKIGRGEDLLNSPEVRAAYLGIAAV